MLTENPALAISHWAGFILNVLGKKVGKTTLTDKANAGAVFFAMVSQTKRLRQASYVWFLPIAQRKKAAREFVLRYRLQKVGLVLVGIRPF